MAVPVPKFTPEEYLDLERKAEFKSEYWLGEVFAMAGVSLPHSRIQGNITRHAGNLLAGRPCEIHGADLKVGIHRGKRGFAYPDAFIHCGPPEFVDHHQDVVTNPIAIFEVLSPSTETIDRGRKFNEYRRLDSLRHYILVNQHEMLVEHFARQDGGRWLMSPLTGTDLLRLADIGLELPVSAIYERVEFPPEADS